MLAEFRYERRGRNNINGHNVKQYISSGLCQALRSLHSEDDVECHAGTSK